MHNFLNKRFSLSIIGISLFVALWSITASSGIIKPLFLPSPSAIFEGIVDLIEKGWLQKAIFLSISRVMIALIFSTLIGFIVGAIMGISSIADGLFGGMISGAKSIPVTGLIGLIILWFGIEEKAKIFFLFLGSVFYMTLLIRDAIINAKNSEYIDIAKDLGATKYQMLKKILFPAALPQIYNAIIVSNSLMWTYIVLAEYINGSLEQTGLGYLIYISSRTQDSAKVFGLLIVIAIIASLFDYLLKLIKRKFIKWI